MIPVSDPQTADPLDFDQSNLAGLKSSKTWEEIGVPAPLTERLITLGFKSPSKIQELVIPAAFNFSVCAQSQNGSGKTLSFLIPAILYSNPLEPYKNDKGVISPQVIILGDTRTLIFQHEKLANKLGSCSPGLKVGHSFSGVEEEETYSGHIVITTIGKLSFWMNKNLIDFGKVKLVIMDEADQVLAADKTNRALEKLLLTGKSLPLQTRMIITTATLTEEMNKLVQKLDVHKRFYRIDVEREKLTLANVKQYFIRCDPESPFAIIDTILESLAVTNILIFANKRKTMHDIQFHLVNRQHKSCTLASNEMADSNHEAEINDKTIEKFMQGQFRILISTNVISRGIDMRKVSLVINYELPILYAKTATSDEKTVPIGPDFDTYLHRVGRTGRYGDRGIALNMIFNGYQEADMQRIREHYKIPLQEISAEDIPTLSQRLEEISDFNTQKRKILEEDI